MSRKPSIVYLGLGALGRMIVADLAKRDLVTIAAAVDPLPTLAGRSLADVVPGAPAIPIVASLDAVDLSAIDAAIVTTASYVDACMPTFRTLLAAGCSIVSTCEELTWPWLKHAGLADELDALAKANNAAILGTGVNPGFMMDTIPVAVTSVCTSVNSILVERIQNATPRRIPFQRKIGVAMSEDAFAQGKLERSMGHAGLGESLQFVANRLNFTLERWDEDFDPVRAEQPIETALGPLAVGDISGVRQVARGYQDGRCVIELVFQAAVGQVDPRDRVVVDGTPPLDMTVKNGVHGDTATVAITINALRPVLEAAPGLHTMATVPVPGCWR